MHKGFRLKSIGKNLSKKIKTNKQTQETYQYK